MLSRPLVRLQGDRWRWLRARPLRGLAPLPLDDPPRHCSTPPASDRGTPVAGSAERRYARLPRVSGAGELRKGESRRACMAAPTGSCVDRRVAWRTCSPGPAPLMLGISVSSTSLAASCGRGRSSLHSTTFRASRSSGYGRGEADARGRARAQAAAGLFAALVAEAVATTEPAVSASADAVVCRCRSPSRRFALKGFTAC